MAVETQDYLDEAKNPSVQTLAQMKASVGTALRAISVMSEQAELWARHLTAAELAETNPEVAGQFEAIMQKFGAMRRITGELERKMRELHATGRQWKALDVELRALATKSGYTV